MDVINQTWSPMFDMINIFEVFLPQLLRYPNPTDPLNGEAAALLIREPKSYEAKVKGTVLTSSGRKRIFRILTEGRIRPKVCQQRCRRRCRSRERRRRRHVLRRQLWRRRRRARRPNGRRIDACTGKKPAPWWKRCRDIGSICYMASIISLRNGFQGYGAANREAHLGEMYYICFFCLFFSLFQHTDGVAYSLY